MWEDRDCTPAESLFFDEHTGIRWHTDDLCEDQICVIHNPSNHALRTWPMVLREHTLIERQCTHGIGHPDPDSYRALNRINYGDEEIDFGFGIHGCDGCCTRALQAPLVTSSHEAW